MGKGVLIGSSLATVQGCCTETSDKQAKSVWLSFESCHHAMGSLPIMERLPACDAKSSLHVRQEAACVSCEGEPAYNAKAS